jgi:hypothetical protein
MSLGSTAGSSMAVTKYIEWAQGQTLILIRDRSLAKSPATEQSAPPREQGDQNIPAIDS